MSAKSSIASALEALTATTKAGRLRELMPTIEAKVAAGVRHEDILEALNANGFELTERTYKTYLYRFRKVLKADNTSPPATTAPQPLTAEVKEEEAPNKARFFSGVAAWIEGYRDEIQHRVFFANQPPRNRR